MKITLINYRMLLGATLALSTIVMAAPDPDAAITVKDTRIFLSQAGLNNIGLANHDSTMPIVRLGDDSYWIYFSEGGARDGKHSHIVRVKTSLSKIDPSTVEELHITDIPDAGVNNYNGWKAWMMAPLYKMGPNECLAILHLEDQDAGAKECFRMATAFSSDGGLTFKFLGFIISPTIPDAVVKQGHYAGKTNLAGAGLRWDETYAYFYFSDMIKEDASDRHLAVARVARADLEKNARAGQNTSWYKYYDGKWNEPGMGGRSTKLATMGDYHSTIAYNTHINRWILFSIRDRHVIMLRLPDPLDFNVPDEQICDIPKGSQINYCTIQPLKGEGPQCGRDFYLFYRLNSKKRYDTGRMTLSFKE